MGRGQRCERSAICLQGAVAHRAAVHALYRNVGAGLARLGKASDAVKHSMVIGIVGAESTGKTSLALALHERLRVHGHDVIVVGELLREFCFERGRTPGSSEQAVLASAQSQRINVAAEMHSVVVADTTALMTAVYSDFVFGDSALYPQAERAHMRFDLTLLTALDLPWRNDGLQRDGAHVRGPVDQLIRAALQRIGRPFAVVAGAHDTRLRSAWAAVQHALHRIGSSVENTATTSA